MTQLNQEHAEIRLSAFQIASELFSRSHYFRTLLVDNFQVGLREISLFSVTAVTLSAQVAQVNLDSQPTSWFSA